MNSPIQTQQRRPTGIHVPEPTFTLHHDGTPSFLQRAEDHATVYLESSAEIERGWVVSFFHGDAKPDELFKEEDGRYRGAFPVLHHQKSQYRFKVVIEGRVWWYNQGGISPSIPSSLQDFSFFHQEPPEWVFSRVFYQIFPDRFKNGNPDNDPVSGEYKYGDNVILARNWDRDPNPATGANEFFGGDLEGIRQGIPYLQDLGVNAVYLNPIFESPSSHGYDTQDYYRVDGHFGSNEELAALVEELHQNDIRIVLDGVFNHTGDWHKWMNRQRLYPEDGAFQGGKTRDYYCYFGEGPEEYMAWFGFPSLPKLNYAHEDVKNAMYRGKDSVVKFWLKAPYHIDGWRLDAAPHIGKKGTDEGNKEVLAELWQAAREVNPEAYIFGEHFADATPWLQGGVEDATMNYHGFTIPTWAFLGGTDEQNQPLQLDAAEYAVALQRNLSYLPFNQQRAAFNSLCSHDIKRFASVCPDLEKQKLGAALLLTFIGVPCIFYGDEIGMQGEGDPESRKPMPWDDHAQWETGLFDWYKQLIRLRHQEKALREGAFRVEYAREDHLVWERRFGEERVWVVLTRETPFEFPLEGQWTDLLTGKTVQGQVQLSGTGVHILKRK